MAGRLFLRQWQGVAGGTSATLDPGVYCGGIAVSGGANVTFNPGTYIINGGGFVISGGSTVATPSKFQKRDILQQISPRAGRVSPRLHAPAASE